MIRRPPRSTLFPYTRSSDLADRDLVKENSRCREIEPHRFRVAKEMHCVPARRELGAESGRENPAAADQWEAGRSEEHTSELQSRSDLVCRLLLEKKKN